VITGASADLLEPLRRQAARGVLRLAAVQDMPLAAKADSTRRAPMILFGAPSRGSPVLPWRWPRDDRPQRLPGRFNGTVDVQRAAVSGYNVLAMLRGADPELRDTWVALSAHYDHLGILPPVRGDSVAHGADDDGSGCVALLAVARAMSQGTRARRSVLFVWHTGEEEGLLGSAHFTAHPTVPLDSIVALINADMVGRNAPDSLYIVGPGTAPRGRSSALGRLVDSVNATLAAPFAFNRSWDAPDHPERLFYRGDPYHYAHYGVPVVFFTSGLHADYHQVSDQTARIDFAKLAHVSQLLYALGESVANRTARPQ
jgi:Zn-dependent M28 family amino/carboxypeptidase